MYMKPNDQGIHLVSIILQKVILILETWKQVTGLNEDYKVYEDTCITEENESISVGTKQLTNVAVCSWYGRHRICWARVMSSEWFLFLRIRINENQKTCSQRDQNCKSSGMCTIIYHPCPALMQQQWRALYNAWNSVRSFHSYPGQLVKEPMEAILFASPCFLN